MLFDVHQHILPPNFVATQRKRIVESAPVIPPDFINWTPERALEQMDGAGISAAILSISTPGVWTGDAVESAALARGCNDYGAEVMQRWPDRFGMVGALPLPDTAASLVEIEHCLDVLKLDGIGLMSNYDDRWLGDPAFARVFEELDRRGATVLIHPTGSSFTPAVPDVALSILEYPTDTTRTILNLLFSGALTRFSRIRFVFPHGGGSLAMVLMRVEGALTRPVMAAVAERLPDGALAALRRQYFDVTNVMSRPGMAAMLQLVPPSQLLFGTDFPYWPARWCADAFAALDLDAATRTMISGQNASVLFPRFFRGRIV